MAPATVVAALPFNAAAREHTESAFDVTVTPGTTAQEVLQGANQSLPAEGYLRSVYLEVTASGGTLGAGAFAADAPYNVIQSVTLSDVNGAPIFGPVSGYDLYLINKYGGFMYRGDPAATPDAVLSGNANFAFIVRIPLEINRQTGFGSLANQNAAAAYKLRITCNTSANVFSTAPTTVPAVRFRGFIETWTQPLPQDAAGRPQATQPPAHGTTQYWTKQQFTINGGQQIVQLTRVGNLIRSLFFVYRTGAGARITFASGNMPDPIELDWDARMYFQETLRYRRAFMVQSNDGFAASSGATQVDDGVMAYNWDRSIIGHTGGGSTAMYLPTVQSTRLQINASFGAAGVLEVITNDVAPVEVNPNMRYAEGSATGFHPQVGTPIPGAGS